MKNYVLSGLLMLGLILAGCAKDDEAAGGGNEVPVGDGVITVKLLGDGIDAGTKAGTSSEGNTINDYLIYVFNHDNGILETKKEGDPSLTTEIEKVSTATGKRVVVLTNRDGNYPTAVNYSDFLKEINYLNLDEQTKTVIAADGYAMSGESGATPVRVTKDGASVEIKLKRVVAKVILKSITFDSEEGHDLDLLEIKGVSAQRVAPDITWSPLAGIYSTGAGGYHYGGISGADPQLQVKSYLREDVSIDRSKYIDGETVNFGDGENTFIVFLNNNADNCTLLTIAAEYDGKTLYYPVKVNHTDVNLVESNKIYNLNVTLKRFGDGTTDPEIPNEEGTLEVTVEVVDWVIIDQNEEW